MVSAPRNPPQISTARSAREVTGCSRRKSRTRRLSTISSSGAPETTITRDANTTAMLTSTCPAAATRLARLAVKPTRRNTSALTTKPKYSHRSSSSRRVRSVMPTSRP